MQHIWKNAAHLEKCSTLEKSAAHLEKWKNAAQLEK